MEEIKSKAVDVTTVDPAADSVIGFRGVDGELIEVPMSALGTDDVRSFSAVELFSDTGQPAALAKAGLRWGARLLPTVGSTFLAGRVWIPSHWTSFKVVVDWVNTSGAAGGVRFQFRHHQPAGNGDVNGETGSPQVTGTALGLDRRNPSTIASNIATAPGPLLFRVGRLGNAPEDTLDNDIAVLGVDLVRDS